MAVVLRMKSVLVQGEEAAVLVLDCESGLQRAVDQVVEVEVCAKFLLMCLRLSTYRSHHLLCSSSTVGVG